MAVKIIQLVNLWHGKNHRRKIARNAEVTWWKRETSYYVQMKSVDLKRIHENHGKNIEFTEIV